MGRRLLSFGLCIALQVGALSAPFVHAHVGRSHAAHAGGRIHTHLDGHVSAHRHAAPDGLAVETTADADADVVAAVQLFVAVHTLAGATVALALSPFALTAAHVSMARPLPDIVRSHGPPPVRPLAARAPPVSFLS